MLDLDFTISLKVISQFTFQELQDVRYIIGFTLNIYNIINICVKKSSKQYSHIN